MVAVCIVGALRVKKSAHLYRREHCFDEKISLKEGEVRSSKNKGKKTLACSLRELRLR